MIRALIGLALCGSTAMAGGWPRHVIDDSSRGADGTKFADVNGDGRLDIVTGWEEGGVIRAYVHPGGAAVRRRWPSVQVGTVPSPEDAVFVDLDGDGAMDVVSATEGKDMSIHVHWAPRERDRWLEAAAWTTRPIPAARGAAMWMQILPMKLGGAGPIDLVVASKNKDAGIGWLESPADARDLASWKFHPLYQGGWLMSLHAADLDADGDLDILASDRKGRSAGVLWLENGAGWRAHRIGLEKREVMFIEPADFDGDGAMDIVAAVKERGVAILHRPADPRGPWPTTEIEYSAERHGTAKAARAVDLDLDGRMELVVTCENADGPRSGVFYLARSGATWTDHDIGGPEGVKYDLIGLIDLDSDGDPDLVTCEERDQLGVVWYENPARKPVGPPASPP